MIKIVTIDLDGTLFDDKKNISDLNLNAIKKCKELGVKIVLATGRPISGVMPTLEYLGLNTNDDYVIIYNGAKIFNVGTQECIFSSNITGAEVKELFSESKRLDVNFHAFRDNGELITPKHNPYTDVEATINHVVDNIFNFDELADDDLFLKAMMVGSDDEITKIMKKVKPYFRNKHNMLRSSKIFLEFLNKNTNKGYALEALAKHLNVDIKDTMAIGDAGNDIPMIEAAGIGVAMANSFKEVLDCADFITSSNLDSGVAYVLKKFIIDKENED